MAEFPTYIYPESERGSGSVQELVGKIRTTSRAVEIQLKEDLGKFGAGTTGHLVYVDENQIKVLVTNVVDKKGIVAPEVAGGSYILQPQTIIDWVIHPQDK